MANPVFIDIPKGAWTKVATGVVTGQIWRAKSGPIYLHTYRLTTGTAPTDSAEGMPIFRDADPDVEQISSNAAIDVYIYCPDEAGRVRVDI